MARNPRAVGAISPASAALAEAMAAQVDFLASGRVLELGPGTGAITKALIRHGQGPERLLAVEADAAFAKLLRARFPGLEVIEGDATDAGRLEALGPFIAIVSSLPLLNFSPHDRLVLVRALLGLLPPGAPFVQYSYGLKPPLPRSGDIRITLAEKVWRNLPPARIWVFQSKGAEAPVQKAREQME